jgi:hypothetical protein
LAAWIAFERELSMTNIVEVFLPLDTRTGRQIDLELIEGVVRGLDGVRSGGRRIVIAANRCRIDETVLADAFGESFVSEHPVPIDVRQAPGSIAATR